MVKEATGERASFLRRAAACSLVLPLIINVALIVVVHLRQSADEKEMARIHRQIRNAQAGSDRWKAKVDAERAQRDAERAQFDIGEQVGEVGRPSTSTIFPMHLGDTGALAFASPRRYTDEDNDDWDYYAISILLKCADGCHRECFRREFTMEQIEPGLLAKEVAQIVSFDAATRRATFTLGQQVFSYTLPE